MALPAIVADIVGAYLKLLDVEVAGLVEGVYLVGSVALGDFRPRSSDIDFVAVTAVRPDAPSVARLRHVHRQLRRRWRRPFFDGVYVTRDDLARDPALAGPVIHVHEGRLQPPGPHSGESPVTRHMLAHHALTCHGPRPDTLGVHTDRVALAGWTDANLDGYWRPWLARSSRPGTPCGWFALTPYAAVWLVTGVSRMHYTLATGDVTSKEGAARYALATFPSRWRRVVSEALRIRQADLAGSGRARTLVAGVTQYLPAPGRPAPLYRTPLGRRSDLPAFGEMVIADAHRLYRAGPPAPGTDGRGPGVQGP